MYKFEYYLPRNLYKLRRQLLSDLSCNGKVRKKNLDKLISSLIFNIMVALDTGRNDVYITLNSNDFNYKPTGKYKKERIPFSYGAFVWCITRLQELEYASLEKGYRNYGFYPELKIEGGRGLRRTSGKMSKIIITSKFLDMFPVDIKNNYTKMSNSVSIDFDYQYY